MVTAENRVTDEGNLLSPHLLIPPSYTPIFVMSSDGGAITPPPPPAATSANAAAASDAAAAARMVLIGGWSGDERAGGRMTAVADRPTGWLAGVRCS